MLEDLISFIFPKNRTVRGGSHLCDAKDEYCL